jgi:hypothetical protein
MAKGNCSHCGRCDSLTHGLCHRDYARILAHGDPGPAGFQRIRNNDEARLESKIDRSGGPDACHPWLGPPNAGGYGIIGMGGKCRLAHDVSWEMANGCPIPAGPPKTGLDHMCHVEAVRAGRCRPGICPHRLCCNPAHLVLKTQTEHVGGSANSNAKLIEDDVREIRLALASGESHPSIAKRYGVGRTAIGNINTGVSWAWLDASPRPESA